jgi:Fic family protein
MQWVWQLNNWPTFHYNDIDLGKYENEFERNNLIAFGATKHITTYNLEQLKIELLTQEGVATSSIEGEILQRESVQNSIQKRLGLKVAHQNTKPIEAGIAELMTDVYLNYNQQLTHDLLHNWHKMINNGRRDIDCIGEYRKHMEPMQIVSGNLIKNTVYYEAPPSENVWAEMDCFIKWYNENLTNSALPTLIFAGIVHLYFECIHPYEDGNGRIGRALVEKAISQRENKPILLSLSKVIDANKKNYYTSLQQSNTTLDCTKWLLYYSETIVKAQVYTNKVIDFSIAKTKFLQQFSSQLNPRQEKVILRLFEAGLEDFKGGLSASNYCTIANTSAATATRDLQELVAMNALLKEGQLKSTRYSLNLEF